MKPKGKNLHIDNNTIWRVTPKSNTAAETLVSSISLLHADRNNYEGTAFKKIDWSMICLN